MRTSNSATPPPPPHARINVDGAPTTDDSEAGGLLLLSTLVAGIVSILFGTMSLALWFSLTEWTVLSMPLALLAIVLANVVLVAWWFLGGDIDIRIHVIGLTLGVVGVLGWFVRTGEFQKIVTEVRTKTDKPQKQKGVAGVQPGPEVAKEELKNDEPKQAADVMQDKPKQRVDGKRTSQLTVDAFRTAAQAESDWSPKQTFYNEFGKPSRVASIGDTVYLYYDCKDGTARVECPAGPFEYQDMICPLGISQSR